MSAAQEITRHHGGDWHGSYGTFPAPGHSKHDRGVTVKDISLGIQNGWPLTRLA